MAQERPSGSSGGARRRRPLRRWTTRVLVVLGILGVAVYLIAPIVAARIAESRLREVAAERLDGTSEIGAVDVSWSGRVVLRNVKIRRADGPPILDLPATRIDLAWGALWGGPVEVAVVIERPILHVRREDDGRTNLEHLLDRAPEAVVDAGGGAGVDVGGESRGESVPQPPGPQSPLPVLRADVRIEDAAIILEDGGSSTRIEAIRASASLPALDREARLELEFTLAGGGDGRVEADVTLAREGRIAPSGRIRYALDAVALSGLEAAAALWTDLADLGGVLTAAGEWRIGRFPEASGADHWTVDGLTARRTGSGTEPLQFPPVEVTTSVTIDPERVGRADVSVTSGGALRLQARADFGRGESVEGSLTAESDLQASSRVLRGLLRMKAGSLLDGRLRAEGTFRAVGRRGSLKANLLVDDPVAVDATGARTPIDEKITMDADLEFDGEARSLEVTALAVDSTPVTATAHGRLSRDSASATYRIHADLDALSQRLALFLEEAPALAGRIEASGEAESAEAGIRVRDAMKFREVTIGPVGPIELDSEGDALLELDEEIGLEGVQRTAIAAITLEGRTARGVGVDVEFRRVGARTERLVLTSPGLSIHGSGTVDGLTATIEMEPEAFGQALGALLPVALEGALLRGEATLTTDLKTRKRRLVTDWGGREIRLGETRFQDPLVQLDVTLGEGILVHRARVESSVGRLVARGRLDDRRRDFELSGDADLDRLVHLLAPSSERRISGRVELSGAIAGSGPSYAVSLTAKVPEAVVSSASRTGEPGGAETSVRTLTLASRGEVKPGEAPSLDLAHRLEVAEWVQEGRTLRDLVVTGRTNGSAEEVAVLWLEGPGLRIEGAGPWKKLRAAVEIDPVPFQRGLASLLGEFELAGEPLRGIVDLAAGERWSVSGWIEGPELVILDRRYRELRTEFDLLLGDPLEIRQARVTVAGGSATASGVLSGERRTLDFQVEGLAARLAGGDPLPRGLEIPGRIAARGNAIRIGEVTKASVDLSIPAVLIRRDGGETLQGRMGPVQCSMVATLTGGGRPNLMAEGEVVVTEAIYEGRTTRDLRFAGTLHRVEDRIERWTILGPGLTLDATGPPAEGSARVVLDPSMIQRRYGLFLGELGLGGRLLNGRVESTRAEDRVRLRGELSGPELHLEGKVHRDVRLAFDVDFGDVVALHKVRAATRGGWFELKGTYADESADLGFAGEGELAQAAGFLDLSPEMHVDGRFSLRGSIAGADVMRGSGDLEVARLTIRKGDQVFSDPSFALQAALILDRKGKTIRIGKGDWRTSFARGVVRGTIHSYDRNALLQDVAIDVHYSPGRSAPLLALFVPGEFVGEAEQRLTLNLAGRLTATELTGRLGTRLEAYEHLGIRVRGPMDATLDRGMLSLRAPFETDDRGRIDVTAGLDLRDEAARPTSRASVSAQGIVINEKTARLLEKLHPLFHLVEGGGRLTGLAGMSVEARWAGALPGDEDPTRAAERALTGSGRLHVRDLQLSGSMLLGNILSFLGEGDSGAPGEATCESFVIGDGRVSYDLFRVFLQGLDMKFSGSIYFDQRLDMMMEVPITPTLVAMNPTLEKLLGQGLRVPVRGTIEQPVLDFGGAIAEAAKGALIDRAGDFLKDLFGGED